MLSSVRDGHLYLRDKNSPGSVQLDVPQGECVKAKTVVKGRPRRDSRSLGGRFRVFFTDTQRSTADAGAQGKADLHACEVPAIAPGENGE